MAKRRLHSSICRHMPLHRLQPAIGAIVGKVILNNEFIQARAGSFGRHLVASLHRLSLLLGENFLGHGPRHRPDTTRVAFAAILKIVVPALTTLIETHGVPPYR